MEAFSLYTVIRRRIYNLLRLYIKVYTCWPYVLDASIKMYSDSRQENLDGNGHSFPNICLICPH